MSMIARPSIWKAVETLMRGLKRSIAHSRTVSGSSPSNSTESSPASSSSISSNVLIGRLLADERWKGRKGKPGGFPSCSPRPTRRSQRRGGRGDPRRTELARETWFPSRERAAGERRSSCELLRSDHAGVERHHQENRRHQDERHRGRGRIVGELEELRLDHISDHVVLWRTEELRIDEVAGGRNERQKRPCDDA